jgi:electron transport complex protein RnfC
MKFVDKEKNREARDRGILDCIECGSCSYVCPSKINLVHFMKLGKYREGVRAVQAQDA